MVEQQVLEEAELTDRVVGCAGCLLTLKTGNTDSDLRCRDHVHVICAVTDGQSSLFWVPVAHHHDDLSFLLGAHTASENDICTLAQVHELFDHSFVLLNSCKSLTSNDHCIVSCLLRQVLIAKSLDDLDANLFRLSLL